MILEFTRGHIRMSFEDKTVTILGEAHLPGPGSPGFLVYSNSITQFDPPESTPIDAAIRARILKELARQLRGRNATFEIE